jgi:class 3 adenylate cyclase
MSDSTSSTTATAPGRAEWLAKVKRANGRDGNYLAAYDLSMQALALWPDALLFEHQAILALARLGVLGRAIEWYRRIERDGRLPMRPDQDLAAEFAGLHGRLLKDMARTSSGSQAAQYRLESAQAYANSFRQLGKYYLAINAASMYLSCGEVDRANLYAHHALKLAAGQRPVDYWSAVTQAEARLILGQPDAAADMLRTAAAESTRVLAATGIENLDEVASTRRQLAWVAALVNAPLEILNNLPTPCVWTWIARPMPQPSNICIDVPRGKTTIAFGALMSEVDVEMADALLANGVKLHLVLPCEADLLATRILGGRRDLAEKFVRITGDHENVEIMLVTKEGDPNDPAARLLGQQQARGLALLRARNLGVVPQLINAGTEGVVFDVVPDAGTDIAQAAPSPDARVEMTRQPHAIVFGDVHGFSTLTESEQLIFIERIVGGFAKALKECGSVEYAETAGDGLFIVLPDVLSAIDCCMRVQKVVLPESLARMGLPGRLGIRLSAHVGPLYRRYDKVIRRHKFVGMEVIRTARIEPVTPVGEIFVTEQFAAMLAFTARDTFICEYAGLQPMAKNFGECRMYSLRRAYNPLTA